MKNLLLVFTLVVSSFTARADSLPEWYPASFDLQGGVNEINLKQRYVIVGDVQLPLADKVVLHGPKLEYLPVDRLKASDIVGVKISRSADGLISVEQMWLMPSNKLLDPDNSFEKNAKAKPLDAGSDDKAPDGRRGASVTR